MEQQRSLEYQLRAAEQRLAGIRVWLHDSWTFAAVADRHDAERDIVRLQRAIRKEQHMLRVLHHQQEQQLALPFETHNRGEMA